MNPHLDPAAPTSPRPQLERAVQLVSTAIPTTLGEPLPTVRQLAADLHLDANTVSKAYAELERAGIIESREGVWTLARLYCLSCGAHFGDPAKYCKQCGASLSPRPVARRGASPPTVAGVSWAVAAVSVGGLVAVLGSLSLLFAQGAPVQFLSQVLILGLLAIFGLAGLLLRQLSRLITHPPEPAGLGPSKRAAAHDSGPEPATKTLPPEVMGVTESTTRSL